MFLGQLAIELDEMDLEGNGAEGGSDKEMGPPTDNAIALFTKHTGKDWLTWGKFPIVEEVLLINLTISTQYCIRQLIQDPNIMSTRGRILTFKWRLFYHLRVCVLCSF